MIIIKTKNGDRFINDKAVTMVEHDHENAVVNAYSDKGVFFHIEDVEGVIYTNDAQPILWKDQGSEFKRMKAIIEKKEKDYNQLMEHSRFMREWFSIYQNAFSDIKDEVTRLRNGSKRENLVIESLIEATEKKYQESQKRFEEVRAKWED